MQRGAFADPDTVVGNYFALSPKICPRPRSFTLTDLNVDPVLSMVYCVAMVCIYGDAQFALDGYTFRARAEHELCTAKIPVTDPHLWWQAGRVTKCFTSRQSLPLRRRGH